MSLSRGKIIVIVAVIVSVTLLLFARQSFSAEKQPISTMRVTSGTFTKKVSSSGKTVAKKSVDLKFQTSGKLAWVGVDEGDSVSENQSIASLDKREVQKNLEKELIDYAKQRNDFEEAQRVTYNGHHLPNDVPNDSIKRILEKNQWDLDKAVLDVELSSLALSYATLVSPIAGIVTHIDTPVAGVNITPATAVFQVIDPSSVVFQANIDETDVGSVQVGQEAQISLDAFPDKQFHGHVSWVSYAATTTSGGGTVFPVDVTIDSFTSPRLGFNGDVSIVVQQEKNKIAIPNDAIREEDGKAFVYTKAQKDYKKTFITVSESNDEQSVVTKGLKPGDEIVVKGIDALPKSSTQ